MAVSHVKSDTIADYYRSILSYSPDSGEFRWLVKRTRNGKANVGDLAGNTDDHGYRRAMIDGRKIRLHRLAFVMMGYPMPEQVDHINGNRSDNRWLNLRAATGAVNAKNAAKRKDGHTAITGVGYMPRLRKWRVRLNHGGKSVYLGVFKSLDDAINARKSANPVYGFHANHGRA